MYIKCDKQGVRRIHNDEYMPEDYYVEFSENGVANVKEEVGEQLIENYDSISEYNKDD